MYVCVCVYACVVFSTSTVCMRAASASGISWFVCVFVYVTRYFNSFVYKICRFSYQVVAFLCTIDISRVRSKTLDIGLGNICKVCSRLLCFPPGKDYPIQASTRDEMLVWVAAIEEANVSVRGMVIGADVRGVVVMGVHVMVIDIDARAMMVMGVDVNVRGVHVMVIGIHVRGMMVMGVDVMVMGVGVRDVRVVCTKVLWCVWVMGVPYQILLFLAKTRASVLKSGGLQPPIVLTFIQSFACSL